MSGYDLLWILVTSAGLAAALAVIAVGYLALRKVVEDLSDIRSWSTFGLRAFKIAPGVALIACSCVLLWKLEAQVLALTVPGQH
jgi:uncharacterized BrkB/YihY/UPF0761 family membrane protein